MRPVLVLEDRESLLLLNESPLQKKLSINDIIIFCSKQLRFKVYLKWVVLVEPNNHLIAIDSRILLINKYFATATLLRPRL